MPTAAINPTAVVYLARRTVDAINFLSSSDTNVTGLISSQFNYLGDNKRYGPNYCLDAKLKHIFIWTTNSR